MRKMQAIVLLSAFLIIRSSSSVTIKPYRMTLLQLILMTGAEPRSGKACRAAGQLVADLVNNRSDILPDYHIDMQFEDEAGGRMAANAVASYARRYAEDYDNQSSYQSPVIVGPHFSTGCKAIGRLLHHLNLVDISTFCAAPFLTDRKSFPNLYLMVSTGRVTAIADIQFVKYIGRWKKIAIISNAANVNDYTTAMSILKTATENGIEVPWFDIVLLITPEKVQSLKAADIRVIVLYSAQPFFYERLLCEAHILGMTGPKYVFIINMSTYMDPINSYANETIYPGCTRAIVIEQMRYTIWIGQASCVENTTFRTELGQTIGEFNAMLDSYVNNTRSADDNDRCPCHDVVLRGIISLHSTEKRLKRDHNLTLRNMRDHPLEVMKAANQSVFESNVAGLRIGRMFYGPTGEVDNDVQVIGYWTPESRMQYKFIFNLMTNATTANFNDYSILNLRPMIWPTRDGNPPRDQLLTRNVVTQVADEVFITTIVLGSLLSAYQLSSLFGIVVLAHGNADVIKHFPLSKVMGLTGCLCLNAAAIIFASSSGESAYPAYVTWVIRIVLLFLSFSAIHGILAFRILILYFNLEEKVRENPDLAIADCTAGATTRRVRMISETISTSLRSVAPTPTSPLQLPPSMTLYVDIPNENWPNIDKGTAVLTGTFFAINTVYLICWLLFDPLICEIKTLSSIYLNYVDELVEYSVFICLSHHMMAWMFALLLFHFVITISCGYIAYKMGPKPGIAAACPEFPYARFGLANTITLLLGSVLIVVINNANVNSQQTAISFAALAVSATTSQSWIYPISKLQFS